MSHMQLDAQTKALLDEGKASGAPPLCDLPVDEGRQALKAMTLAMDVAVTEVARREERTIPGSGGNIPVRIYWPEVPEDGERLPVLLLYHGGGFALGDLDSHENVCRFYCGHAGVIVISVDYSLSPEHEFPAGVDDCYAALCWAAENAEDIGGDSDRLGVIGDSAGGNLSAVVCQLAKARGGPSIAYQVLVYPAVDFSLDADYESRRQFGTGDYFLGQRDIDWIREMYLADMADAVDPRASPILTDDLSGLPEALVITAGFDPLADEGKAYAERLKGAGVPVEYRCFESTIHGFMAFAGRLDVGKEGLELVANRLRETLGAHS